MCLRCIEVLYMNSEAKMTMDLEQNIFLCDKLLHCYHKVVPLTRMTVSSIVIDNVVILTHGSG